MSIHINKSLTYESSKMSLIKCQLCNIEKEKKDMHSGASNKKCKDCISAMINQKIEKGEEKACSICHESKTWDHFWFGKDQCRECQLSKRKNQRDERKTDTSTRVCNTCKVEQPIQQFEVRRADCKECVKQVKQPYLKSTRAHRTEMTRKYRENHPEYVKKDLENTKEYNRIHRKEISAKERERVKNDPAFRVKKNLRIYFRDLAKDFNDQKPRKGKIYESMISILGCDARFFRSWLAYQFDDNMTFDNQGSYWHIDHITPTASFDLTTDDGVKKCFHWSNMQPLEKTENMKKSRKVLPDMIENKRMLAEEFKTSYISI